MRSMLHETARSSVLLAMLMGLTFPVETRAITQILPDATIEGDQQSILELIGTFDRAEEAIRSRNLDALMSLYADDYDYHGLTKSDVRKLWAELLGRYEFIANIHTFSAIRIMNTGGMPTAEIICTGALWATSKETRQRIPIDSWHQEGHHLIRDEDGWRIMGHAGGTPAVRQFGTAPHPLF